jgi:hypothetical protein
MRQHFIESQYHGRVILFDLFELVERKVMKAARCDRHSNAAGF